PFGKRVFGPCFISAILLLCAGALTVAKAQGLRLQVILTNGPNLLLRWNSTAGVDYQLQRSLTNRLPINSGEWVPQAALRASNAVTVLTEPITPAFTRRFYRLLQLTSGVSD